MPWLRYLESVAEVWKRMGTGRPPAREATYKGVTFRSKLEVRFAWYLDHIGEDWRYEPRVYGEAGRRYLPDFEILGANRPTFIEVKPTLAEVYDAEHKMAVIWDTEPDALLMVACEESFLFSACRRGGPRVEWHQLWALT